MAKYLLLLLLTLSFISVAFVSKLKNPEDPAPKAILITQPPTSIVVCGIADHPCVRYAVSYHQPTGKFGDRAGDGVTDYEAKTISIASSRDSFVNVSTLVHEVYHATLWERGFTDKKPLKMHEWIYFSEGAIAMVLHDNPDLTRYIATGY
jgi:hypothetical protein